MLQVFKNNRWLLILLAIFIISRFFGLNQLYHQDEYRWIMQADPQYDEISPHPPLAKYFFRMTGFILGFDHMRWAILLFSIGNILLVYGVSLKLTKNRNTALIASALLSVNIYSIIASLQIDIDGAILPFFVLLGFLSYVNIVDGKNKREWWFLMAIAVIGGFFSKLSFALFIGAITGDYLFRLYLRGTNIRRMLRLLSLGFVISMPALGAIFYLVYLRGSGGVIINYALHFNIFNFGSRAYSDLIFKIIKSMIWLSPLLAIPVLGGLFNRQVIRKYFFWYLYLAINLIFYLFLFDFTKLTIERYLMFLIVPSVIISAEIISNLLKGINIKKNYLEILAVSLFFVVVSLYLISLYHDVIPLNPKSEYINHIKSLSFNFLIPMTGGSGPIGFYVSARYILWAWVLCIIGFLLKKRPLFVYIFLIFSIGYNLILSNEFIFGSSYGSVNNIVNKSLTHVTDEDEIKDVITYYDTGAYYLRMSDKYNARFYTAPTRDYTVRMSQYRGHYMIVDFPAIDKGGVYWKLISKCKLDKKITDKYVDSYIFDCRQADII